MNVLVWFRRDLRIADHAALALAAARGRVLPVWLADPEEWRAPERAGRHWAFAQEALSSLRTDLAAFGLPLVVRLGSVQAQLERLVRLHDISEILSLQEAGCPQAQLRDRQIAAWARDAGLRWNALAPGSEAPPLPARVDPVPGVEPGVLPSARALGLADDPCPHRQAGGRDAAMILVEKARRADTAPLGAEAAHPLRAERVASRLSPHLAWGTLSAGDLAGLRRLQPGLARRARAQAAWAGPEAASAPQTRPREGEGGAARLLESRVALAAWQAGETGLPFLDACLRYLRATGWLHERLRALLAGSALRLFGLEADQAGALLARRFTDYDPAVHGMAMRAAAALPLAQCDAIGQGLRLDPEGAFLRRWLPELAGVPTPFLHRPWRWEGAAQILGRRYPEPLLDPVSRLRDLRLSSAPSRQNARGRLETRLERAPVILLEDLPGRDRPAMAGRGGGRQLQLDL